MVFRVLVWLAAFGACVWVLALDRIPADPVRQAQAAPNGDRVTLVLPSTALGENRQLRSLFYLSDKDPDGVDRTALKQPAPWLTVYSSTPGKSQAMAGVFAALSDARDYLLAEPVFVELDVELFDRPIMSVRGETPAWTGVYPVGPTERYHPWSSGMVLSPETTDVPGAVVAVAKDYSTKGRLALEQLGDLWREYHRATGGRITTPPFAQTGKRPVFFATDTLNPGQDYHRDDALRTYLRSFVGPDMQTAGGLVCWEGHTEEIDQEIKQWMADPRLIRLATELSDDSPERRESARRTALCDDDPHMAEFAALDFMYCENVDTANPEGQERIHQLALVLEHWPHPVVANSGEWDFIPQVVFFNKLPPEVGARELLRMARTTADVDRLSSVLTSFLPDPAPEPRHAAQAIVLDRLPCDTMGALALPVWAAAERDVFFRALAQRLQAEFRAGDVVRASLVLSEAIDVYQRQSKEPPDPLDSQLSELAGQILFDDALGPGYQRIVSRFALRAGALERLHDSDPEIRRRACVMLKESDDELPAEFAGDPFVADLIEAQPQGANASRAER